ncbi:MAG: argininosuccinate synthase domain-containing protein, partial [Candidatus Micrarchaeota archaeon]
MEKKLAFDLKKRYEGIGTCIVAYTGRLDSVIVASILKEYMELVLVTLDIGQKMDLAQMQKQLKTLGIKKHRVIDAKEEFVRSFVHPAIKANYEYEGHPDANSLSRPLIAKYLVEVAKKEGAQAIAHGSTGKGNDQIRIDNGIRALKGDLIIIAPIRDWELFRDEEIEYAMERKLPMNVTKKKPYSIDQNIWGR